MKLLSKKLLICIGVFCLFTTSVCFADNYKMVSEKKDADGNREVTYDNGKISTFNYDETYVISEVDEGDFTIDTYNDGSVTKIYTWQLKEMERLRKDKKFLSIGFNTKKNNDGTKTVTRIRYSETKEWIDVPNGELILQQNDSTPYQCHLYLAKKFFPNDDIYTKRMEYNEHAQAEKERLQAQYAEAHEKAEEKRQEQQAKQEEKKAELNAKAGAKKSYEEASVDAAKNNAIDPSIVSDKTIREYIELYNGKSGVNDPSQHKLAKIGKANYIIVQLKSVNYVFDIDGYKAYIDDIYESAKEALNELKGINNSTSQINEIIKRVDNDAKTFAVGDTHKSTCKQLCNAKSKELKDYVKTLGK